MNERERMLIATQLKLKEARALLMSAANIMYKAADEYGDVDYTTHRAIMASVAGDDIAQEQIATLLIGDSVIPPA